ncbi:MAG: glycoside hydrolase family 15 protein, partial [Candidatus Hydrogenedentales bacterium]
HPRMLSTFRRITEHLGHGYLLMRYTHDTDDGLPSGEGAFGLCSFWDDEYLAKVGDIEGAKEQLEGMLQYANDVGLFAEEIDPRTGELLGNFPQAFTHVGLINAALSISEALGLREPSGFEQAPENDARNRRASAQQLLSP